MEIGKSKKWLICVRVCLQITCKPCNYADFPAYTKMEKGGGWGHAPRLAANAPRMRFKTQQKVSGHAAGKSLKGVHKCVFIGIKKY